MTTATPAAATDDDAGVYRPNYVVAAEKVIDYIARRGLRPGDRLPTEQALADELQYGRGVIREAIKILTALGRVHAHKGKGIFVADDPHLRLGAEDEFETFLPADPGHVEELMRFRQVLEGGAARRAATSATPPQLRMLREAASASESAARADDRIAFDLADSQFHARLLEASANRFLESAGGTARRLQSQIVVMALHGGTGGSLASAAADHEQIVTAVMNGDAEGAEVAARYHIERTLIGYQAEIASLLRQPRGDQ
ncbi:FadR/GntR family transcriptional regulator [Microbacterium sp.]|uniref:FadR/GntR family transcriptional regulator n=1 Tax=Microbacterium sp. TaxID=51671 RepID=UPI003F71E02C